MAREVDPGNQLVDVVPGASVLRPSINLRGRIGGSPSPTSPLGTSVESEEGQRMSLFLTPLDARAVTTNNGGFMARVVALKSDDSALSTRGMLYPGNPGDDNDTQWEVPVPLFIDTSRGLIIRLHLLIP